MRAGRRDEALSLFTKAIARDPTNAEALLYLAGALASGGRPADALPYFERSIKADPTTMALNGLGMTRSRWANASVRRLPFVSLSASIPKQPEVAQQLSQLR